MMQAGGEGSGRKGRGVGDKQRPRGSACVRMMLGVQGGQGPLRTGRDWRTGPRSVLSGKEPNGQGFAGAVSRIGDQEQEHKGAQAQRGSRL